MKKSKRVANDASPGSRHYLRFFSAQRVPLSRTVGREYNVIVALDNHTIGPEDFAKAMAASKQIWVNLDVRNFVASGYDPIP